MNTGQTIRRSQLGAFIRRVAPVVCASVLAAASVAWAAGAQTFPTAEAAVDALVAAARSDDPNALLAVLGDDARDLVSSGDDVADASRRARFVAEYDEAHELVPDGDNRVRLEVGEDEWELPLPIVETDGRWSFDVDAGIDEVVYRRIGRNEIGAIDTCRGIVEAQNEYASEGRDGGPAGVYARKLVSDPGTHDGLYWPSNPDERASPIGPFIAHAASQGYRKDSSGAPQPYHGYVYRLLTAQGPAAPGGAKSYLENGRLSGGFAVIAYPIAYRVSGVTTFLVGADGVLYQKDLGPKTAEIAARIETFNPDPSWSKVD